MKKIIALLIITVMGTICLPIQNVQAKTNSINTHKISRNWKKSSTSIEFPILMYHSIAETGNSLNVPIKQFEEEISYLRSKHYYFLTPHEAYTVLKTNKRPQKKIVWVTMDDGYKNNFDALKNIYKNHHAKATVFDIINSQNGESFLSEYQLKHLKNSHISIQNHTFHHIDLDRLTDQKQAEELLTGKNNLDKLLHQKTIAVAYPAGHYNQLTPILAAKSGHKLAVTTNEGLASKANGLLTLNRVRVNKGISIKEFQQIIING